MEIPIDQITSDQNQPRKIFSEDSIKNLAKSMKTEGLIHAIEVDPSYKIIVGEMRYRAAKSLGWEKINASINTKPITPYERLRRQMAENLQQSGAKGGGESMNAVDTARGWARLYELLTGKGYEPGTHPLIEKDTPGGKQMVGAFEIIAEEIGVKKHTAWEYLKILEEPKYVLEDIMEGRPRTYYREADKAPKEVRDKLKKKIAAGHYEKRQQIRDDMTILRQVPSMSELELERQKSKESKAANRILTGVANLTLALEALPFEKVDMREKNIVKKQLEFLLGKINDYLKE